MKQENGRNEQENGADEKQLNEKLASKLITRYGVQFSQLHFQICMMENSQ